MYDDFIRDHRKPFEGIKSTYKLRRCESKRRNRIRWERHNFYDDYKNVVTCSNYVDMSLVGPFYVTQQTSLVCEATYYSVI